MEKLLVLILFILLSSSSFLVSSYNVPAIFTFGDSIFDAGNNHFNKNCSAQADFPPYGSSFFYHPTGRFTNGRTVPDFICHKIGAHPLANLDDPVGHTLYGQLMMPYLEAQIAVMNGSRKDYPSNGINFASAGSGVLRKTNQEWGVTSIQQQLQQFQTLVQQNLIDKKLVQKSIFLLESGSNDIFNYFFSYGTPTVDPDAYVQAMLTEVANLINQIYRLGARRIAVFSLGPVGCVPARVLLPDAPTNKCFGKINLMVKTYNQGLENLVKDMPIKYPGAVGVYSAVYDIVQQYRAIPTLYGFSDVTNACCGDGILRGLLQCGRDGYKICPNPKAFLFWDYFHPTEHTYELISQALWAGKSLRIRPFNLKTLASMP